MAGICPCTMGNSISAALGNLKKAKRLNPNQPENTSPATVLSRRVVRRNEMFEHNLWAYLVTFRLESGEEVELEAGEDRYKQLKEEDSGTLTWRENTLLDFA